MKKKPNTNPKYSLKIKKENGEYEQICGCKTLKELMGFLQTEVITSKQDLDNFKMDIKIEVDYD